MRTIIIGEHYFDFFSTFFLDRFESFAEFPKMHRYTFSKLKTGYYSFRVRSLSLAANGAFTDRQFVNVSDHSVSPVGTLTITAVLIIVCISTAIVVIVHRRYGWSFGGRNDLHVSRQNLTAEPEESPVDDEIPTFIHQTRYPYMELFR